MAVQDNQKESQKRRFLNFYKGLSTVMDSLDKQLHELFSRIEASKSTKFIFKPLYHGTKTSMHCFEVLVSSKGKKSNGFACTFFFDCTNSKIYVEDYGALYSGRSPVTTKLEKSFQDAINLIISFVAEFSDLHFKMFQTTSRIPEKFDFLEKAGFERKEQLNHYENTKFVKPI